MATYTITTTPAQDQAIAWLVDRHNEADPANPITANGFVQAQAAAALAQAQQHFAQQAAELVPKRFVTADAATKLQVLTILGIAP